MASSTSKKHHARLNNPFPRAVPPAAIRGADAAPRLSFSPTSKLAAHAHDFPVGTRFRLRWDPSRGGQLSVSRVCFSSSGDGDGGDACARRTTMWETVPGVAFLAAAAAAVEADECRGSFALRDGCARLVPHAQHVDKIKAFYRCDADLLRDAAFRSSPDDDATRFPVLVITGHVSATKKKKNASRSCCCCGRRGRGASARPAAVLSARYWVLLEEKSDTQVAFSVKFGDYHWTCAHAADPAAANNNNKPSSAAATATSPRAHHHRPGLRLRLAARVQRSAGSSKKTRLPSSTAREETSALLGPPAEKGETEEFNRVFLTYASSKDERFYGFGEQFSRMEFKGRRVPVLVQEQGIGRGDQPITFAANLVSYRSGGNWSTTYAPSPFYMTSKMRALYLEGYDYSIFDLTKPDRVQFQIYGNSVQGRILNGDSPTELLTSYTESTGRPPVLPRWITSGAVVGMQGGTDTVRRVWKQLQEYDVPISAFWLQDWVGQRKTAIGSQLWWNWEMDQKPNTRRHLFEEAKKLGILVKDQAGEPYMMPNTAFDVAMLDFTNPEAHAWFKKILQGMADDGVSGWMADFGEGLPLDARLHSGEDPVAAHNRYPELWARVNREFADEWKARNLITRSPRRSADAEEKNNDEEEEDGLVFFVRSGFRESSRWAMLFWEGDQMVSWQANDGIKSSVVGLLSGGLSGFPLNHSDAGGYCTVDVLRYRRSEELLLRWMELNAFTVVFRTHEGNKPGSNCQFYSNARTLAHFARCAKMYRAWEFYRVELVKEAAETGLPVARHLFLHYPEDERVQVMTYEQFMVGTEVMVVPVLDKDRSKVTAYFPAGGGAWKHVWTGDEYGSGGSRVKEKRTVHGGFEAEVGAPVGYPAVFVRAGSDVGERFVTNLRDLKLL
ncbi:hypothetical protein PR202_ga23968 [Eleusine coracana subsp. coracana]|uniref:Alpha-glucosidase n=1 Tax=Eleusine coracana subsp. coracana TaxID=191504 RepID=A0AAV5D7J4_ELECO|nr:hypothetical protein PR202_ga23968 [Eleusine coracana subsp. coracana]